MDTWSIEIVESRKNQDKLKKKKKYRENIIQDFTAPRYILLWNGFVRQVGWVEPAHYKTDRQNIWKHTASQNYFTGIWCLSSPCVSAASILLSDLNQFSSALAFQSTRNIKMKSGDTAWNCKQWSISISHHTIYYLSFSWPFPCP